NPHDLTQATATPPARQAETTQEKGKGEGGEEVASLAHRSESLWLRLGQLMSRYLRSRGPNNAPPCPPNRSVPRRRLSAETSTIGRLTSSTAASLGVVGSE